jgi:hypothetical protein
MTQLAREIGRKSDEARVRLETTAQDGILHIGAEPAGLAGYGGLMHLKAHVEGPDGNGLDVDLLPATGGSYVADVPIATPGSYVVRAIDVGDDGSGTTPAGLSAAVLSRADELRPTGSDHRALERIAELSGGVVALGLAPGRDDLRSVFFRRTGLRPTALPLAPYLLPIALALMLLGVAARRLGVPGFIQRAAAFVARPFMRSKPRAQASVERVPIAVQAQPFVVAPLPTRTRDAGPIAIDRGPSEVRARAASAPAGKASGVAAAIAQKRKEAAATKTAPTSPVIARVEPKRIKDAPKPADGASSLADLAKKKREKKG